VLGACLLTLDKLQALALLEGCGRHDAMHELELGRALKAGAFDDVLQVFLWQALIGYHADLIDQVTETDRTSERRARTSEIVSAETSGHPHGNL